MLEKYYNNGSVIKDIIRKHYQHLMLIVLYYILVKSLQYIFLARLGPILDRKNIELHVFQFLFLSVSIIQFIFISDTISGVSVIHGLS